jgi:hypothetical protein
MHLECSMPRPHSTSLRTSSAPTRLAKLAAQLTAAEGAYQRSPSPRSLTRVTTWYHRWYWASQAEADR